MELHVASQAQEQHASMPGGPAEQPCSYQSAWVQNAVRQPAAQSCQCSRPGCEPEAECCPHASTPPGSPPGSAVLSGSVTG